ncbi:MAG: hypothetical protein LBC61_04845 [Candidatus Peribacteria bacterium]|nr:hypothetical protein [Candidatus Peribacteria bacterium]
MKNIGNNMTCNIKPGAFKESLASISFIKSQAFNSLPYFTSSILKKLSVFDLILLYSVFISDSVIQESFNCSLNASYVISFTFALMLSSSTFSSFSNTNSHHSNFILWSGNSLSRLCKSSEKNFPLSVHSNITSQTLCFIMFHLLSLNLTY